MARKRSRKKILRPDQVARLTAILEAPQNELRLRAIYENHRGDDAREVALRKLAAQRGHRIAF